MEVLVNNKLYAVQPETTLAALLQFIQISTRKGIAVAVNQKVVPRLNWNAITLRPADQVTIIQATQGG
ncbi:sulfur carrier protein ThiS [Chitinophaga barathri]|uniref:Sulfur carrier protein ThiS n=1 Tax=Chitinophaga barathri TaxID=1647451 RepID=A0A3N4MSQ8_9BACT|nr:sulfur carrier protein ThiS [Chitinophaga barathri]RPD38453.1 sulfur carrier protein ThiS [Chitinophaga barathri]